MTDLFEAPADGFDLLFDGPAGPGPVVPVMKEDLGRDIVDADFEGDGLPALISSNPSVGDSLVRGSVYQRR